MQDKGRIQIIKYAEQIIPLIITELPFWHLLWKEMNTGYKETVYEPHLNFSAPLLPTPFYPWFPSHLLQHGVLAMPGDSTVWTLGLRILDYYLVAVWPWKSYWTYLSLTSLSCRMKMRKAPAHGVIVRIKWAHLRKALSLRDGLEAVLDEVVLLLLVSANAWLSRVRSLDAAP